MAGTPHEGVMGRPSLMAGNLFGGNFKAAMMAGLSPGRLSPEESQTIIDRAGLDEGIVGTVLEGITNPFVILGAIFSIKFPVPKFRELMKVGKQVQRLEKYPIAPQWMVNGLSPFQQYRGLEHAGKSLDPMSALLDIAGNRARFINTHVPAFGKALDKWIKKSGRGLNTTDNVVLAAMLDGLDKVRPSSFKNFKALDGGTLKTPFNVDALKRYAKENQLDGLVGDIRGVFDDVYSDVVLRHPEMEEELRKALMLRMKGEKGRVGRIVDGNAAIPRDIARKLREGGSFKSLQKKLRDDSSIDPGMHLDDYWVHQLPPDMENFHHELYEMLHASGGDAKAFGRTMSGGVDKQISNSLLKRQGRMLPDIRDLEKIEDTGLLDKGGFTELREKVIADSRASHQGLADTGVLPYRLHLADGFKGYAHKMASTYSFNRKGAGRRLMQVKDDILKVSKEGGAAGNTASLLHANLEDTIIPLVSGRMDVNRAYKAMHASGVRTRVGEFLATPMMKKALGAKTNKWMRDKLLKEGSLGYTAESDITALLYSSTLGLPNVASASVNAMQSFMTTMPLIGPTATAQGFKAVFKKIPKYYDARVRGLSHLDALDEVFPHFREAGFGGTFRISESGLDETFEGVAAGPIRKGISKAKEYQMTVFEKAETFNQLVAWEGATAKAMGEMLQEGGQSARLVKEAKKLGKLTDEAAEFGRDMVYQTQFPGGVVNAPLWISRLKGHPGGRLATMFTQFNMRFMEFHLSAGLRLGSGAFKGRNWGTLARASLISGLMYEGFQKGMGRDVSRLLATGGLPEAREGSPLYPIPFGGPAASIVLGGGMDLIEGEFDKSRYALPLLVPGGVGAARMAGFASEDVAKALGRKYIDYDQPSPDGRYAVYSASGKGEPALVGHYSPGQIVMQGLGMPGGGTPSAEPEAMKWLMGQRERILGYKREYLAGMIENNPRKTRNAESGFERAYPEIKGGLKSLVKPADVGAVQMRRNVPRLERVLNSLPQDMRPMFGEAIRRTLLQGGNEFLGVDPKLLGRGSTKQLHPFRPQAQGQGAYQRNAPNYGLGRNKPGDIKNVPLPNVGGY